MLAYIVHSGTRIEPFGDPIGETLILDRPFSEVQQEALRNAGCESKTVHEFSETAGHSGPSLVLTDHLFTTSRLLKEFVEKARAFPGTGAVRLVVKKGLFTRLLAPIQETTQDDEAIQFPLWYVPEGAFSGEASRLLTIDIDEESYAGNFPKHMIKKDGYRFCVTSRPVILLTHPLHLALANMAANFARLAELKKMTLWEKVVTLAKARSLNKFKILGAVSRVHPEAEVHPTAVIEGSVVEKGAKIGAYAVVRFSHVGENAFIDDHAGLKFSVVGKEAYVANNCVLFFTVAYPRAFLISGPYQFSLFGYDTAMMNSIPADYRMDGSSVPVQTATGVKDTGLKFVGSVIGHRTKIAAGVIIAPGRLIPNDLLIFPDPARVINKVPASLPKDEPLFLISGQLIPQSTLSTKEKTAHEPGHLPQGAGSHSGVARHSSRKNHHQSPNHRRPRQ